MYIHQHNDWPRFTWNQESLTDALADMRYRQGRLVGRMEALGFGLRQEAVLETITEDVVKSSDIEGERFNRRDVRSSVARRLGIDVAGLDPADRRVDGVVELTLDAVGNYDEPLTAERLWGWQAGLFPAGRSGIFRIQTGAWRDDSLGSMQVVSGAIGRERVHFEAPEADRVAGEMEVFLDWFNAPADMDEALKAALAHFWFVTIHPFDDGNGRIARAVADMALARSERAPQRFYSMSAQIRRERKAYYQTLERTQRGALDVSRWMDWFVGCLGRAIENSESTLGTVLTKARFWRWAADLRLNDRQRKVINMQLEGRGGKLTTSKWAKLAGCSQDTALRDIAGLVEQGVLVRGPEGGRSTSYALAESDAA